MEIIERITKNLKIVLDNKIEEQAIENIFYAKFCHALQLKNIKFTSINNLRNSAYLSYYAINFINSGGAKNTTLDNIDNCLLSFVEDEEKKIKNQIKELIVQDEKELLLKNKDYNDECKKIENKYKKVEVVNFLTNGGTLASVYADGAIINDYNKGALFAEITEFADYFTSSVDNPKSSNNEFLNMLNNLYDSVLEPSNSAGTRRKKLKSLPFSLVFLSDLEEMLENKTNNKFKKRLKSGFARRVNFYIDKEVNYAKNPPKRPTLQEKQEAYNNLDYLKCELKEIYDNLFFGCEFKFTNEANELIDEWKNLCEEECKSFYKYTDRLDLEEKIKFLELQNSPWKIIKMSVIMQILMNEKTNMVTDKAVFKAIEFYKKCRDCLYQILSEKEITAEEKICNFFLNNQNKEFNLTVLKSKNFVNRDSFPNWIRNTIDEIETLLNEKGFKLELTKNRKSKIFKCVKTIPADEMKLKISISNENVEHPVHEYKSLEVTNEEFIDLITRTNAFSAQQFKDGHRKDKNIIGDQNTLWLDFDNGISINEAREKFKDYWFVIYTTKNHQIKKNNKPACDRFRLILKTKNPLPKKKEEYRNLMLNIINEFDADNACKDISRYYRGNRNAEIIVNNGDYFNWETYKKEEKEIKNEIKQSEENFESKGLNDGNLFTEYGEKVLKANEITSGNRDNSLAFSVGLLIKMVLKGNITHRNAQIWLENKLGSIMTSDFKSNANKYRKRLKELKF